MKFAEVAENVKQLGETPPTQDEFIYELLLAYGTPYGWGQSAHINKMGLTGRVAYVSVQKWQEVYA